MAALIVGTKAPDFTLPTTHGDSFSLKDALTRGPIVVAFFKITCPVCQYAFPYYDRAYKALGGSGIAFLGISQNDEDGTEQFMRQYGVSFPVLLDDPSNYPASNAYGLTNVPTLFLISSEGRIELSSVGWSKADLEDVVGRVRESSKRSGATPLFQASEDIADFRAG
jgi:peroxiredoxin